MGFLADLLIALVEVELLEDFLLMVAIIFISVGLNAVIGLITTLVCSIMLCRTCRKET